jgi:hypothetical protein
MVAIGSLLYYAYGIKCLYILCLSVIASHGIIVKLILSGDVKPAIIQHLLIRVKAR